VTGLIIGVVNIKTKQTEDIVMCCFGRMIIMGRQKEFGERSAAVPFRAPKLTK
jgi:hypothetical protein